MALVFSFVSAYSFFSLCEGSVSIHSSFSSHFLADQVLFIEVPRAARAGLMVSVTMSVALLHSAILVLEEVDIPVRFPTETD
jgi:hypothetical protein